MNLTTQEVAFALACFIRKNDDAQLLMALFNKGLEELAMEGKLDRYKTLLREGYYQNPEKPVNFDRR